MRSPFAHEPPQGLKAMVGEQLSLQVRNDYLNVLRWLALAASIAMIAGTAMIMLPVLRGCEQHLLAPFPPQGLHVI